MDKKEKKEKKEDKKMEDIQIIDFSKESKKKKKTTKAEGGEKKKTKKTAAKDENPEIKEKEKEEIAPTETTENQPAENEKPSGSIYNDPFTYDFLLNRINSQLKTNNPNLLAEKTKFVLKPPQIVKISGKRAAFLNFLDICNTMKRSPEHVSQFFLTELGTEGSVVDEQLIKHIESLIIKYIGEYVSCPSCKSPKTSLNKDSNTRLYIMKCDVCQSSRSVTTIKSGFHALAKGERKRMKYK